MTSKGTFHLQSNPSISNSVNSKSPLFRTKIEFPWIYPYVFSHLLSAISNSVISNSPLFQSNSSFFPNTLNQTSFVVIGLTSYMWQKFRPLSRDDLLNVPNVIFDFVSLIKTACFLSLSRRKAATEAGSTIYFVLFVNESKSITVCDP